MLNMYVYVKNKYTHNMYICDVGHIKLKFCCQIIYSQELMHLNVE